MVPVPDPDVALLAAAADPARLAILRQLAEGRPVCACDFTDCCGLSQPTVSHHLRVLRESGWVETERRGTFIYYRLHPAAVERLARLTAELGRPVAAAAPARTYPRRLQVLPPA